MGAPSAMVSFYPDIPEVETATKCGEFVFLMDRSGSMKSPMSSQNRSQLRIDAAKVKAASVFPMNNMLTEDESVGFIWGVFEMELCFLSEFSGLP